MNESPVDPELRELGKQLPWQRPDEDRRDAVRSSLLVAATLPAPERERWKLAAGAFAAGALAAAAVFALLVRRPAPAPAPEPVQPVELAATVDAPSTTRFERAVTHTAQGTDEVVRVHDGVLAVTVPVAPAGSRFRIATRDAELEGAGAFRLSVANETIREVTVDTGNAVLRVAGQPPVFLAAGQTWKATVLTAAIDLRPPAAPTPGPDAAAVTPAAPPDARAPAHRPITVPASPYSGATAPADDVPPAHDVPHGRATPPSRVAPSDPPPESAAGDELSPTMIPDEASAVGSASAGLVGAPPAGPPRENPVEQHFKAGWALLQAKRPAEAARELGAAAAAGGDDALAADARYFQAIALTRAGRKTEAEAALVAFLDHAPTSLRRGRAAVMLARLIAERGDIAAARAWFTSALSDPDPDVVAAARRGLAAL